MIPFSINIMVAVVWLMLSKEPNILQFFIGYTLGFLLIVPFSTLIAGGGYTSRVTGIVRFLFLFLWEFIKSNLAVAYIVLFVPKETLRPGFINCDLDDLTLFESILLSYCITLTPGTISVKLDWEKSTIIVHCLDCKDPESIKFLVEKKFKCSILKFTR